MEAMRFWRATVGKKMVMAVTGVVMILFLVAHLAGNLLVFRGPVQLDAYSAFLRHEAIALWTVRLVLLAAVVLHVIAAYQLARDDRAARLKSYARLEPQTATLASRTMRVGGIVIAGFVIFHLLHLITGTIRPAPFDAARVYANVIGGFRIWVGVGNLPHRARRDWPSPLSRRLELGAHPGPVAALDGSAPPAGRHRGCFAHLGRIHLHSARHSLRAREVAMQLNARVPAGPLAAKWDQRRFEAQLVSPANRRKHRILVVGSGLAGASAAAILGELGYVVDCFCFQDSPRRAHSIAAQGGIKCGEELLQRRRQRAAPLLRYDEGRRLPFPGGERLPAGRG